MKAAQSLLDERLRALSDPTRRAILQDIGADEMAASDIAARFDMARPTVSRHLQTLVSAKLVTVRKQGTSRLYLTDGKAMQDMHRWFESFWDKGLRNLKKIAESETKIQ